MSPELYLAFVVATVIALVVPGPTILLVVSYALAHGRNVTLALVSGVILGDLIAMSVTLAGLGIVLAASASAFTMMKWAGALYLAWMGIGMIRKAGTATAELQAVGQRGSGTAFRDGFIVTLLNPKSIGFFIAFVPQFIVTANLVVTAIPDHDFDICRAWWDQCSGLCTAGGPFARQGDPPQRAGLAATGGRRRADLPCRCHPDVKTRCLRCPASVRQTGARPLPHCHASFQWHFHRQGR